jgi:hypothetical protein
MIPTNSEPTLQSQKKKTQVATVKRLFNDQTVQKNCNNNANYNMQK